MLSPRLTLLRVVVLLVFLIFLGRLAWLQLVRGSELREASNKNHIRLLRIPATRGVVYDRKGRVLATSTLATTAWLVPSEVPRRGWQQLYHRLVKLGVYPDADTAQNELDTCRRYPSYQPVRLTDGLDIKAISRFEEELAFQPGIILRPEPVRTYPEDALASHLIGYLREIDADELTLRREMGYRMGDRIGKAGLERAFEDHMRGEDGKELVEVDAYGQVLRTLRTVPPVEGRSLTLTIDRDMQRAAESALGNRRGAAVALDPNTGDILTLVSTPSYDANLMSGRLPVEKLAELRHTGALFNRATNGQYPPGSVFKIVTAATALEKGLVPPDTSFYCAGKYHGIHCWKHSGHGALGLTEAIAQSCNVAFMKMAEESGINNLAQMGRRFGLGQPVKVSPEVALLVPARGNHHLPPQRVMTSVVQDAAGLVPDPDWAQRTYHRTWQLGETLQVGIGQSSLQITPLQAARVIAAMANDGKLVNPRLVKSVGDTPTRETELTPLGLKPETLRRIKRGLQAVVNEGTAKQLDPTLHIAGKTGTAQNSGLDHAWFVGFAPAEAPRVAVAVIVEHGGHGGTAAAPVAEEIIRMALEGPKKPEPQPLSLSPTQSQAHP